jgi:hypothetical protein
MNQKMANLLISRLREAFPFQYISIDLAGLFPIKIYDTQQREVVKCWAVLAVCHYSQGVYIDYVLDCPATSLISFFVRLISRYGTPSMVYSDLAQNIVSLASWYQGWAEEDN